MTRTSESGLIIVGSETTPEEERLEYAETAMAHTALRGTIEIPSKIETLDLGRLGGVEWLGGISADKLIESGSLTLEKIDEMVNRFGEFFVVADLFARIRCIDGRFDPSLDELHIGPQLPGGAPGAAFAYRLGVDGFAPGSYLTDADSMISKFVKLGLAPGAHQDEHSVGKKGVVGCAAIDRLDAVLAAMTNSSLVDDHFRLVKQLMGEEFNIDAYLRIMGTASLVNGRSEEYFRNRDAVITMIETKSKNSVATLQGDHKECIISINTVPYTTFNTNKFLETFDGIQAFNYDVWRSKQIAEAILPNPDQAIDRQRYVTARIMTAVATLMVITDGSQRLVVRAPQPDLLAA